MLTNLHAKQAIVTGGAGAIGSRLLRRLLDENFTSVTVVDDLSSGYTWLLPDDPRIRLRKADVNNIAELGIHSRGSIVFHLAAFFANENSVDHPLDDLHTNGRGTLATLMWAAAGPAERLVYASAGCSIAGHGLAQPIREDMPVSLELSTPYQITKALGEFYCNYFQPRVSTSRCRFFNAYGPGEVPGHYRNVIPNFIWRALHDRPLIITGTGAETRDFIFVDDLVDGLLRAAAVPEASGTALNLGTGQQTRILDLSRLIVDACGSRSEITFAPRRGWDHSDRRQADVTRAREVLGFKATVPIDEGIRKTVQWFTENYDLIASALKEAQ